MANHKYSLNRRDVLRGLGAGALGLVAGHKIFGPAISHAATGSPLPVKDQLYRKPAPPAKVALVKGNDRHEIVYQALKNIEGEVLASIGGKKILIKPNFVSCDIPLCATHVDAIRAILDFLTPHYKQQIIIGESTAMNKRTPEGFKNYGYLALQKQYNVKLVDLNENPSYEYRYVFGEGHKPLPVRIISAFLDPNTYIISAARMKTHDRVLVTLSLKNVLLGAPLNDYQKNDKWCLHTGENIINNFCHFNMFHLAQEIYPDLAVIDGFEAMEGNGPTHGTPVDSRVALASLDPLAADTVATKIMGFDPNRILYIRAMNEAGMGQAELEKIEVIGTALEQCRYKFKPHEYMAKVYNL
jgi:uncharacterized protein (DUF362 family)